MRTMSTSFFATAWSYASSALRMESTSPLAKASSGSAMVKAKARYRRFMDDLPLFEFTKFVVMRAAGRDTSLLRARACHVEGDIGFTHRLVNSAGLCGRFQTVH